jgi:hypothetical protein
VYKRVGWSGSVESQRHRLAVEDRPEHPAQRGEQVHHLEPRGRDGDSPCLDLGQIQQIVDHFSELVGGIAHEADLPFLLLVERAVHPIEKNPAQALDRAERSAEFVAHVRQEPALELGRVAQLLRAVVELGVERNDTVVRFGQLLVQRIDLGGERGHRARSASRSLRNSPVSADGVARTVMNCFQPRGQHGDVIATAVEIPRERCRDDRRVRLREAGILGERPSAPDAVGVHDQNPVGRPLKIERLELPDQRTQSSVVRNKALAGAVVVQRRTNVTHPGVGKSTAVEVERSDGADPPRELAIRL